MWNEEVLRLERWAVDMQVKYAENEEIYNLANALERLCDAVGDVDALGEENFALNEDNASRIAQVEELEDLLREIHKESDVGVIRKMVEDSGVVKIDFKVV